MRVVFRCDPALAGQILAPHVPVLPDWVRAMPRTAPSDLHPAPVRTVKQCPPFIDAMTHGFIMPLACDVHVSSGTLSWDWKIPPLAAAQHPRAPMSFHSAAQVEGTPFRHGDQVIVKFNSFWTVELEPGWSLFATHPVNREDLPFRLLTGVVEADRFNAVGLLFPAVWIDPGFEGTLKRGMPVAQCFPVPRTRLDLVQDVLDPQAYDALAGDLLGGTGVYRRRFRSGPGGEIPLQGAGVEPEPPDGG